jgi:4-alpha-glucanotransferase
MVPLVLRTRSDHVDVVCHTGNRHVKTLVESRQSGILLHPTSLPGPYGVGDLGPSALRFLDWLKGARQQLWQVLPLNPTSHGNSPYASPSAFAGNTLLISLDGLRQDGLLSAADLQSVIRFPHHHVDFGKVTEHRKAIFARAFETFSGAAGKPLQAEMDAFQAQAHAWLPDHALFTALHCHFGYTSWTEWDANIAKRKASALTRWRDKLASQVAQEEFAQFMFARQWGRLRAEADGRGIRVVGDAPIFVAFDSADVWAHPHLFKLDHHGRRGVVAGVPPDYFSKDGQLWGNPLYDWNAMKRDDYAWWVERIRALAMQVDIIRIDHFRGFSAAWEVPATAKTAKTGAWVEGPGRKVFDAVTKALGPVDFIAEDLGVITPDVEKMRDDLGFTGMKILQFAFGDEEGTNAYLPHNHCQACVVYTGTHDNDTTRGWFRSLDTRTRSHVQHYLARDGGDVAWDFIRSAWSSVACTAIAPMQDVLDLGTEARMNVPGRPDENWAWRMPQDALTAARAARLGGMTTLYGRHARRVVDASEESDVVNSTR